MYGTPVCPVFDQAFCVDFGAADGQAVERMTEELCLHTAKVFRNGLGIGRVQKMLSE
jgi:hypothetical protein